MATATEIRADFNVRSDAWAFMRACDAAGLRAGFPSETPAAYAVRVLTPTEVDADKAKALADRHRAACCL